MCVHELVTNLVREVVSDKKRLLGRGVQPGAAGLVGWVEFKPPLSPLCKAASAIQGWRFLHSDNKWGFVK